MFSIGDIVGIFAPTAGKEKYHLCIKEGDAEAASVFLLLNSDPDYDQVCAVDCSRVPCLPVSRTGKTVFTFALVPRYAERHLKIYRARKIGELDSGLAAELLEFARTVTTPTPGERRIIIEALTLIKDRVPPAAMGTTKP